MQGGIRHKRTPCYSNEASLRPTKVAPTAGYMTRSDEKPASVGTDERSKRLREACTTGAGGMIAHSVAEIVKHHVRLRIDRMYLRFRRTQRLAR
jgi:hypothetical protein